MGVLSIVLLCFLSLVLLVIVYGFTRPRMAKISRSAVVKATPDVVFPYLESLKMFVENWSPWTDKDPNAVHEYNDIEKGEGAAYSWKGAPKKVGEGSMKITKVIELEEVHTDLEFKGRGKAKAIFYLEPVDDDRAEVIWTFESDNGNNPIGRIFGAMMDRFLGPDYEKGLNNLRNIFEKKS